MGKNILVIGSGGREHALCWKLAQSAQVDKLWCSPGNAGISEVARCINLLTHQDIITFCQQEKIALVVIGPEQPLVEGLADHLRAHGIPAFGPSAKAAQLEGSKAFTKEICRKYNIPTAAYGTFTNEQEALAYTRTQSMPIVVKADGLAAGKGVIIAATLQEAESAIREMFSGQFGAAGSKVVIEECMEGPEVSFFALADGQTAMEFGTAQDHKRAYDNDEGPNTGGMGTYSPPPIVTEALRKEVMERIIHPTVRAMQAEGMPFSGVLFAGLMITKQGPKLLEYNARFGDPETQSLMLRLDSDLLPLLEACAQGTLSHATPPVFTQEAAICVVMATQGYPGAYQKGSVIDNLEAANATLNAVVFHAGTALQEGKVIATGGRVLGVCGRGHDIAAAREVAYRAVATIDWPEGFFRKDIAWQAVK